MITPKNEPTVAHEAPMKRRQFVLWAGRSACLAGLGGVVWRILSGGKPDASFVQPPHRHGWQIRPEKCRYCGLCSTACVRSPSAVKAVNDQKKCSNCVVCYGHIKERQLESTKIESHGTRVCPRHAVDRKNYSGGLDGYYLYSINPDLCIGCSTCVAECNTHGTGSMFLMIRPDLCLGCNECAIARVCPHKAIERVPLFSAVEQLPDTDDLSLPEPSGGGVS